MKLGLLTVLLLTIGGAAWTSADLDVGAIERLPPLTVEPRSVSPFWSAGRGCLTEPQDRVVLRAPRIDSVNLSVKDHIRIERAVIDDWRREMTAAGVPNDLLDRTLAAANRQYRLSVDETRRLGCGRGACPKEWCR